VQDAVACVFAGFGVGADLRKKINVKFKATFKEKLSKHILIVNETKNSGNNLKPTPALTEGGINSLRPKVAAICFFNQFTKLHKYVPHRYFSKKNNRFERKTHFFPKRIFLIFCTY